MARQRQEEGRMGNRRRVIACAVGAVMVATWATTLDAGAAPRPATGTGCHGLSPASAQDCTPEQIRAALDLR
ncbi:MAG TPA: hypothetical protein VFK42_04275 [Acidimicrobiales bacterium]|nr:hypothetical protein [Acidimicrobiales bacterium]